MKEITSQSSSPQYNSIVRFRSTTQSPAEELTNPAPTTVLSVQISSLLNSPSSDETASPRTDSTTAHVTEASEPEVTTASTTVVTTTTTPVTTTTTTTPLPPSTTTRRNLLRRRGSTTPTTPTTAAAVSTTQVSTRNYAFIRRRRPLSQPNEISAESDELVDNIRRIRSTTPDSREVDVRFSGNSGQNTRFRSRFQISRNADSIPAAASQVSEKELRSLPDEELSLTAIDVDTSEILEDDELLDNSDYIRGRVPTTLSDRVVDSEMSAATIDERRSSIVARGRTRFSTFTTESIARSVSTEAPQTPKRPTFARFTPRPFARNSVTTKSTENQKRVTDSINQRIRTRLPFGRSRPVVSTSPPLLQARKLPFKNQPSTSQPLLISNNEDEDIDNKSDDISLSESSIAEKEHDVSLEDEDVENPIKSPPEIIDDIPPAESQSDTTAKRKFKVIRRRPTSIPKIETTTISLPETTTPTVTRIRKIIRKKIKPIEDEPVVPSKNIGVVNAGFKDVPKDSINYGEKTRPTTVSVNTEEIRTTTEYEDIDIAEPITEILKENAFNPDITEKENQHESESQTVSPNINNETDKPEVVVEDENKSLDISDNKELPLIKAVPETVNNKTESNEQSTEPQIVIVEQEKQDNDLQKETMKEADVNMIPENATLNVEETTLPETTTEVVIIETTTKTSTTQLTSPSPKSRSPYKPSKKFTSSTTSIPSSSRTFSRKYNPGAYTSPATVEKPSLFKRPTTKRPLFTRTFTRRTFPTARTTPKLQYEDEEEYSDEEILDEEPESPYVFVPPSKLFTRKPESEEYDDNEELEDEVINENSEELPEEENYEDEQPVLYRPTSKRPPFSSKVVNSNTFRTTSSTTQIPRRPIGRGQNNATFFNIFAANKAVNGTKKRVQNVPIGYGTPKAQISQANDYKNSVSEAPEHTEVANATTISSASNNEYTTTESDDYLSMPEVTTAIPTDNETSPTTINSIETETINIMEIDNSTDDYLEDTTSLPITQDGLNSQNETESEVDSLKDIQTTKTVETITESSSVITTNAPQVSPVIKTQFNKLFSISRVVEVSSKSEKHRLNKNNETTLIEEGDVVVEKKPTVDKIGEVSRFSLIKIFEDEIPIYLTKLGHVYPVDNPPDNPIRIDEARNARSLVDYSDIPKENLVASESMNEGYRHINKVNDKSKSDKGEVEHIKGDDFLSYINDDKKIEKRRDIEPDNQEWQFFPAAYENEKDRVSENVKTLEVVTPRISTDQYTLPLEALFKTETPISHRKIYDEQQNAPFVVYSAPVETDKEETKIVKVKLPKPETGKSIVTFVKGQEFKSEPIHEEKAVQYPISVNISQRTEAPTEALETENSLLLKSTLAPIQVTTTETKDIKTSPIMELLTTIQPPTMEIVTTEKQESSPTEVPTTTTEQPTSTEKPLEESTTPKYSQLDAKRSKFPLLRRPIKPANLTKFNPLPLQRTLKKINSTFTPKVAQKINKTTSFSPSKARFSNRSQNVPIDIKRKSTTTKTRSYTTETPRSTTQRKVFKKQTRTRPTFVPKKFTTIPTTLDE